MLLISHSKKLGHKVLLVDSEEMLAHLPDEAHVEKWRGRYPNLDGFFERYRGSIRSIVLYSVIQYIFAEANLWDFLDKTLSLLEEGGAANEIDFSSRSRSVCELKPRPKVIRVWR